MNTVLNTWVSVVQSAKAALAAALENAEGVREAVAAKEVLEAAQKSSTAAWRSHSVSPCPRMSSSPHTSKYLLKSAYCTNS